jgi:hypothetical protein
LEKPVRFWDRDFRLGFGVRIEGVATPHDGVELGPLAGRLDAQPDPATWSVRLRRTLVPLPDRDADLLVGLLSPKLRRRAEVLPDYLKACKAGTSGGTA